MFSFLLFHTIRCFVFSIFLIHFPPNSWLYQQRPLCLLCTKLWRAQCPTTCSKRWETERDNQKDRGIVRQTERKIMMRTRESGKTKNGVETEGERSNKDKTCRKRMVTKRGRDKANATESTGRRQTKTSRIAEKEREREKWRGCFDDRHLSPGTTLLSKFLAQILPFLLPSCAPLFSFIRSPSSFIS